MTVTDPDMQRGLYGKYHVRKLRHVRDSSGLVTHTEHVDPGPVFVLAYENDLYARVALDAYADSCESRYPQLAADLRKTLRDLTCNCVPDHEDANGGMRDDCPVHGDPRIIGAS